MAQGADMKTFLVFGDARRAENARTFTADIDDTAVRVTDGHATVRVNDRTFDGVVLAQQVSNLGPDNPPYVSMLLSESLPDDDVNDLLLQNGWAITTTAPRAVTVPYSVEAFLLVTGRDEPALYTTMLWMDRALVPTQRVTANPPSGIAFPARVLAMDLPGQRKRPIAAFSTDITNLEMDSNDDIAGWTAVPMIPIPPQWEDVARVSDAIEAKVQYLLSSPVVVGIELHNLDALTVDDVRNVLPADVAEELIPVLEEVGRADLIPEQ